MKVQSMQDPAVKNLKHSVTYPGVDVESEQAIFVVGFQTKLKFLTAYMFFLRRTLLCSSIK